MTTDEDRMRQERVSGAPMMWADSPALGSRPPKQRKPETEKPIWAEDQRPQDYNSDAPETHPLNCDCFLCIPGA